LIHIFQRFRELLRPTTDWGPTDEDLEIPYRVTDDVRSTLRERFMYNLTSRQPKRADIARDEMKGLTYKA
jgi:hypothetical protein